MWFVVYMISQENHAAFSNSAQGRIHKEWHYRSYSAPASCSCLRCTVCPLPLQLCILFTYKNGSVIIVFANFFHLLCAYVCDTGNLCCRWFSRVAYEMGVQLGDEVGYSIRFEDRTSRKTRIKYDMKPHSSCLFISYCDILSEVVRPERVCTRKPLVGGGFGDTVTVT